MWELDHKEGWMSKNCCFWTVVLEMTLESLLDSKEIKIINPKGKQLWIFNGRTDAEAPVLWLPDAKSWLIGKDPDAGKDGRQKEKRVAEDEMVGYHHWFNGHKLGKTMRDSEAQGGLVCCSSWGCRVGHDLTTEQQQKQCYEKLGLVVFWMWVTWLHTTNTVGNSMARMGWIQRYRQIRASQSIIQEPWGSPGLLPFHQVKHTFIIITNLFSFFKMLISLRVLCHFMLGTWASLDFAICRGPKTHPCGFRG